MSFYFNLKIMHFSVLFFTHRILLKYNYVFVCNTTNITGYEYFSKLLHNSCQMQKKMLTSVAGTC